MWPDENGSWDPATWDPHGMAQPSGGAVVANDLMTVSTASGNVQDTFGGFISNIGNYLIARDAARNGMVPARAPNGTPIYVQGSQSLIPSGNGGMLLLLGAVVLGAVLLAKR